MLVEPLHEHPDDSKVGPISRRRHRPPPSRQTFRVAPVAPPTVVDACSQPILTGPALAPEYVRIDLAPAHDGSAWATSCGHPPSCLAMWDTTSGATASRTHEKCVKERAEPRRLSLRPAVTKAATLATAAAVAATACCAPTSRPPAMPPRAPYAVVRVASQTYLVRAVCLSPRCRPWCPGAPARPGRDAREALELVGAARRG